MVFMHFITLRGEIKPKDDRDREELKILQSKRMTRFKKSNDKIT